MKELKRYAAPIILLIILDQAVKLLILKCFMHTEFDILPNLLRFRPIQNTNLSFGGNYIALFSQMWFALLMNILVIVLFITGYRFYRYKSSSVSSPVRLIMVCGLTGCICSFIDKVFWGGSLDFIQIPHFFTFDLKDLYLTIAEVSFVIIGLLHSKEISVKEYLSFCFRRRK